MSIKKIVGTETELRLDCAGSETPTVSSGVRSDDLEDFSLPWEVVKRAVSAVDDFSGLLVSPASQPPEGLAGTVGRLTELFPTSETAVEEHAYRLSKCRSGTLRSDKYKGRFPYYKRFGFTGGYVPAGFRIYVDGSHPEVSTPECTSPVDLVRWEKAGEMLIELGRKNAEEATGQRMILSKDNSDGLKASWGSHENYLVSNELFSDLTYGYGHNLNVIQNFWISFLLSRIIFCGSGKLCGELSPGLYNQFLISQRAEFMTEILSTQTMENRPLINSRDIPYVAAQFGRRLHVISGDSNMCEIPIYLKTGTAMIMLMMLEDGFISDARPLPIFKKPINSLRTIMTDLACSTVLDVSIDGNSKKMTAVNIQRIFLDEAMNWFEARYKNETDTSVSWIPDVLSRLDSVLTGLENDPMDLFGVLDWVTKHSLCSVELDRQGSSWREVFSRRGRIFRRLIGVCGAYHRLDDRGIYNRLKMHQQVKRLVGDAEIERACFESPDDTRARRRGELILNLGPELAYANWQVVRKCGCAEVALDSPYYEP